jgi:hypothetical protein
MRVGQAVLFQPCPICGQGEVTLRPGRAALGQRRTYVCSACSASFVERRGDRYELRHCSPQKARGGLSACTCYAAGAARCYLGVPLSRTRWEEISRGGDIRSLEEFNRRSEKLSSGDLPELPRHLVTRGLSDGEMVHYVSTPVYAQEQQRTGSAEQDRGTLILTSKRLIYRNHGETVSIALDDIIEVSESFPGFMIADKDCNQPHYFFTPPLDPILAAIKGALRRYSNQQD